MNTKKIYVLKQENEKIKRRLKETHSSQHQEEEYQEPMIKLIIDRHFNNIGEYSLTPLY